MTTKRAAGNASSPRHLAAGDWLDVMDLDGVWSVARVLSVPSPNEVEVTYDGWPSDYDEVVQVDGNRVAPLHTYTKVVKCWAKYLNWPMWPSVVTIRCPGNEDGIKNLGKENRLQVDFLDDRDFDKRDRPWVLKKNVQAFEANFEKNRTDSNGSQFERSLELLLESKTEDELPAIVGRGSVPAEYKNAVADSVEKLREAEGDEAWLNKFAHSQTRHREVHMYEVIGDVQESVSDDEPVQVVKPSSKKRAKSQSTEDMESVDEQPAEVKKRVKTTRTTKRTKMSASASKAPGSKRVLLCKK